MLLNYLFILFNMYRTIQFLFHIGYVFIVYLFLEIVPFHLNVLICLKCSFIILRAAESVFITRILFLMLEMCSLLSLSVFSDIYQFFKSLKKTDIVNLQCSINFCCTTKWLRYTYTCILVYILLRFITGYWI